MNQNTSRLVGFLAVFSSSQAVQTSMIYDRVLVKHLQTEKHLSKTPSSSHRDLHWFSETSVHTRPQLTVVRSSVVVRSSRLTESALQSAPLRSVPTDESGVGDGSKPQVTVGHGRSDVRLARKVRWLKRGGRGTAREVDPPPRCSEQDGGHGDRSWSIQRVRYGGIILAVE